MRTIKILSGMQGYMDVLNADRPHHERRKDNKVKSVIVDKLVSMDCPDGSIFGKNVDETATVGTDAEVVAGTYQIADIVADAFIAQGWAEDL